LLFGHRRRKVTCDYTSQRTFGKFGCGSCPFGQFSGWGKDIAAISARQFNPAEAKPVTLLSFLLDCL
jgi:hypothetical protein